MAGIAPLIGRRLLRNTMTLFWIDLKVVFDEN